jgi:hypothetical protein
MIRKLILTAALATATLTGLAAAPATAAPLVGHGRPDHFGRFEVLVRECGHWEKYGTYRDRDGARRAARVLRMRGFDVKVERC